MPRQNRPLRRGRAPQDVLASPALCTRCGGRAFELDAFGQPLCETHADLARLPLLLAR